MSTITSTTTSTASESTPTPFNSVVSVDEEPLLSNKYNQSTRYHEQWMKTALQRRRPRSQLTPDINPALTPSPPEYHFGLSIKEDKLLEYVISKDLLDDDDFPVNFFTSQVHATEYLQKLTQNPTLYTAAPFTEKNDDIVVALYSNYTIRDNKYIDDHERQILDIIRKELSLEGQAPMWHWDSGNF